jgi:hypothetical protein
MPILVTLMMGVIHFSESLDLTRATWHNIPEDGFLQKIVRGSNLLLSFNCPLATGKLIE